MEHVYGHRGETGNEGADRLANEGTLLPPKPDPDWLALEKSVLKGGLAQVLSGDALADTLSSPIPKKQRLNTPFKAMVSEKDMVISEKEMQVRQTIPSLCAEVPCLMLLFTI